MADQRKLVNDQKHMCREQQMPRDDFISFAQANANYCYQLSLWWWSVCNQHRNNPFLVANQGCECTGNMTTDEGYNSCPDRNREDNMLGAHGYDWNYACKDCPQPDMHNFESAHWSVPSHEHLSTDRNVLNEHLHSMIFQQNDSHELSEVEVAASGDVLNVSNDDDDDDDDDDDYDDVEIDDDFRKFLEQSERHRQERDKRKQEALDTTDDYIEVGSAHLKATTCAPSEQPGAKRKEEMKALYGKHVSTIMSLEASLQLNYDKNCDIRQPVFWPSIPLKF
ncbi:uncharacterized protein [Montipora foliosa]|uniref:uncharacterized protein n=1 Tax=Montipora foliosa TaxID=591990 RepID=UPI0035F14A7E